jgi:hypothetical protein
LRNPWGSSRNVCSVWIGQAPHYRLTRPDGSPGPDREILTGLDDHSRLALHVSAHPRITGPIVLATFRQAADLHSYAASTLTDNGMVYTIRFSGGRGDATTSNTSCAGWTADGSADRGRLHERHSDAHRRAGLRGAGCFAHTAVRRTRGRTWSPTCTCATPKGV